MKGNIMTMQEEMERLRKEIATPQEEVAEVETEEEVTEDAPSEEVSEEAPKEEPKKEEIDNATYARMRWEAAEERRKREAVEKRLEAIEKAQNEPKVVEDVEPDKSEDFEAWVEWRERQNSKKLETYDKELSDLKKQREQEEKRAEEQRTIQSAISEFQQYENEFKSKAEDYEDVSQFYVGRLKESVKLLNPQLNDAQVNAMVQHQILRTAGSYAAQGLHPIERMYQDAKAMGYTPVKKEEPKKSNLATIDKNKRRSASVAATAGDNGKNSIGLTDVSDMTMAEFSKLTPEERNRLKREANGG